MLYLVSRTTTESLREMLSPVLLFHLHTTCHSVKWVRMPDCQKRTDFCNAQTLDPPSERCEVEGGGQSLLIMRAGALNCTL